MTAIPLVLDRPIRLNFGYVVHIAARVANANVRGLLRRFNHILFHHIEVTADLTLSYLTTAVDVQLTLITLSFQVEFPIDVILLLIFALLVAAVNVEPLILVIAASTLAILELITADVLLIIAVLAVLKLLLFFLLFLLSRLSSLINRKYRLYN